MFDAKITELHNQNRNKHCLDDCIFNDPTFFQREISKARLMKYAVQDNTSNGSLYVINTRETPYEQYFSGQSKTKNSY